MKTIGNGITEEQYAELYECTLKLEENGIRVVVNEKGEFDVVGKHLARVTAAKMRPQGQVWTPEEMLRYVAMTRKERDVFRGLKHGFRGTATFE